MAKALISDTIKGILSGGSKDLSDKYLQVGTLKDGYNNGYYGYHIFHIVGNKSGQTLTGYDIFEVDANEARTDWQDQSEPVMFSDTDTVYYTTKSDFAPAIDVNFIDNKVQSGYTLEDNLLSGFIAYVQSRFSTGPAYDFFQPPIYVADTIGDLSEVIGQPADTTTTTTTVAPTTTTTTTVAPTTTTTTTGN